MRKIIYVLIGLVSIMATCIVSCNNSDTKKEATQGAISNDSLIKRGAYLVAISGCDDCHTPKKMGAMGPEPDMELRLSGYRSDVPLPPVDTNVIKKGWVLGNAELTGWAGPWGASFAANITSDETGIGSWTEEQFKKALTQGKWKGMDSNRTLLPPMPWQGFSNLTDEDVKAIFAFLKSTKPVKNIEPPIKSFADLK